MGVVVGVVVDVSVRITGLDVRVGEEVTASTSGHSCRCSERFSAIVKLTDKVSHGLETTQLKKLFK